MKIICIGHIAYDITYKIENFPTENTKIKTAQKTENVGGGATNMAYLLGKWKENVSLIGQIGNDMYADQILKELEKANIDTKYIVKQNHATSLSTILTTENTRTVIASKNLNNLEEIEIVETPDLILLDGQEPVISNQLIQKFPNAITILDPPNTTSEVLNLAQKVDYIICSKTFAEELTNTQLSHSTIKEFTNMYQALEQKLPNKNIIITIEEQGAIYKENNQIIQIPTNHVKVEDTTGAGDIFHAVFAYYLLRNHSIKECITYANLAATYSVTQFGKEKSTPTLEQIEVLKNELK